MRNTPSPLAARRRADEPRQLQIRRTPLRHPAPIRTVLRTGFRGRFLAQRPTQETRGGFWARASLVARAAPGLDQHQVEQIPGTAPASAQAARPRMLIRSNEPMTSDVLSVGRLLDGRYRFRLACFQRAYAWRPENVARLLTDLRWAMQQEKRKRFYPLGRVMLAQVPGSSDVEIVDGHQRMVTLTMLFAVLRDLETDPERSARLHRLIIDDAWPEHDPRRSLLTIQAIPARLFAEAVQKRGSTELEPDWPREALSETERNIVDNRDCIRSELLAPGMTDDVRRALADYVLDHCRLVTLWSIMQTMPGTCSIPSRILGLLSAMPTRRSRLFCRPCRRQTMFRQRIYGRAAKACSRLRTCSACSATSAR